MTMIKYITENNNFRTRRFIKGIIITITKMTQVLLQLQEKTDEKINRLKEKLGLNKHDTIIHILDEHKEEK